MLKIKELKSLLPFSNTLNVLFVEDNEEVRKYFIANLPHYDYRQLKIKEKLFLYKAYLWYNFITQDFVACYKYSQKWVDLFYYNPKMKKTNPVFYLKGINYLLESLFLIQHRSKFKSTLNYLETEIEQNNFLLNKNTE